MVRSTRPFFPLLPFSFYLLLSGNAQCRLDGVLTLGVQLQHLAELFAGDAAVLLRQEVHGEMDAAEVAASAETRRHVFRRTTYREGSILTARFAPDGQAICYGASWEGRPVELFWAYPGNPESLDAAGNKQPHKKLVSGDQIIHVIESTSIDQVMRKVEASLVLRRMTAAEAAAVKPRMIQVVTVKSGDTVASLSARMAYPTLQAERFRTLNALPAGAALRPGQRVKIVVYG